MTDLPRRAADNKTAAAQALSDAGQGSQSSAAGAAAGGRAPKRPMSNLQARLITGIIIAAFTLAISWAGGRGFIFFCLCIGAAVLHEWHEIVKAGTARAALWCSWLFYLALAAALLLAPAAGFGPGAVLALAAAGAVLSYFITWRQKDAGQAALAAGGFVYAALFPLSLACLRMGAGQGAAAGLYWVLFLYVAVWGSDIGAYAFGRALGGPKLAPAISPNKTWSGALGGALCAVAAALCFSCFAGAAFQPAAAGLSGGWPVIFAALALSVVAQAGDLLESRFKRAFGVKDSGRLLPGHGGIMDRVDGLLPAAAVFAAFLPLFYL